MEESISCLALSPVPAKHFVCYVCRRQGEQAGMLLSARKAEGKEKLGGGDSNEWRDLQTTKSTLSAHSCFNQSNVMLTSDMGASQSLHEPTMTVDTG